MFMKERIKIYILVFLAILMIANLFLAFMPSFPIAFIILFVQFYCLRKEDWAFVFLILGTVFGAYFAQNGIRFVGSTLMLVSSVVLLYGLRQQLFEFLKSFAPLYLFLALALFSIAISTGGDYSASKFTSMLIAVVIYSIAYVHLLLRSREHNMLYIGFMILIYSLFMVYYMTEIMGTRLSLESFLYSFAGFRNDLNTYKYESRDAFTINYQELGMYACVGLVFSIFSRASNSKWLKLLAIVFSFVVVWYSSARQAFLVFVLILLSYAVLSKKLNIKYLVFLSVILMLGYTWMFFLDAKSMAFLMGSTEGEGSARDRIIKVAMSQFYQNSLLGVGFGRFYIDNEYGCNEHNLFVELLAEMGIVGLLFFFVPILNAFVSSYKYIKRHILEFSPFLCLFLAYFVRSLVSSDLRETILVLIMALVIKKGYTYKIWGL